MKQQIKRFSFSADRNEGEAMLGRSKGHIVGDKVTGGHTTVIEGADKAIKKLAKNPWFVSVRPNEISADKSVGGGQPFVAISPYRNSTHKNTITLTFKRAGMVQKIDLVVNNWERDKDTVINDITKIVTKEWNGARTYNRFKEI